MWEYQRLTMADTMNGPEDLMLQANALGSIGWEMVGVATTNPIGFREVILMFKREVPDWPAPADLTAAWCADPTGRFEQRYWDGIRWTQHASSGGEAETDWPNRRP